MEVGVKHNIRQLGKQKGPMRASAASHVAVGREGVEPSRCYQRQILSLLRLPIPPSPRRDQITLQYARL